MPVSLDPHDEGTPSPFESADTSLVPRRRAYAGLEASRGYRKDADIEIGRPSERDVPEAGLRDYIRVISRRRWTAASVVVLVLLGTVGHLATATPMYEASTTLLIESDTRKAVTFASDPDRAETTDEYYQTQYKLLASRTLAAKTMDALKLWDNAEFSSLNRTEPTGLRGRVSRAVRTVRAGFQRLSGQPDQAAVGPPDELSRRASALDAFLGRLVVSPVSKTRLVVVKFRSANRDVVARVANAHARAYIEQDLESRLAAGSVVSKWLEEQLAQQRQKVEESESAVQQYREEHNALGLDDRQSIVEQKLSEISGAVTRAKTVRIEKESLYNQVKAVEHDLPALGSFPAILSNPYVQQLKVQLADLQRQEAQLSERLGGRHPELVKATTAREAAEAKLRVATEQIVQSLESDYLAAVAQEDSLMRALRNQEREVLASNRTAIEGNVLKRDSDSNRNLYEALLQRTKESGIVGELKPSNLRIVDQADVPRSPVSPRWAFSLVLAMLGGPLLAVGLVFLQEFLHERITTADEVLVHLGLPTLGLVPSLPNKGRGQHLFISNGVPVAFAEAFRTVRTSVLLSPEGHRARTVLVTSTAPGEGKTLSASNLAIGFAQLGERVLLVDCDTRRPSVHEMFDIEQQPGLTDLLTGQSRAKDAVRPSSVANLWVMPAGKGSSSAAELLGSKPFKEFLSSLDGLYDRVVLDSPPVLPVTDAAILAHMAGGIVFVVSAATERRGVKTAVSRLEDAGGQFIGVVLNRANLADQPGYYGDYY